MRITKHAYHLLSESGRITDDEERRKLITKLYGNISLVTHCFSVTGGTEIVYTLFVNDVE